MNNKELKVLTSRICNNNDDDQSNYRQSFERFCDDLCEVIVSYLSLDDKIRFECVSKQFKRCVYNKQNNIQLKDCFIKGTILNRLQMQSQFNFDAFDRLLRKCKNVNKICVDCCIEPGDQFVDSIIRNCNYLKFIKCDFFHISEKSLVQFGSKFGQKLKRIEFLYPEMNYEKLEQIKSLLKLCPNLTQLKAVNIQIFDDLQLFVPRLERVDELFISQDKYVEIFVNKYKDTLKKFEIEINYLNDSQGRQNFLLRQISRLKNLEELHMKFTFCHSSVQVIKTIAMECTNLKHLVLNVNCLHPILESIGYFENLEYLAISGIEEDLKPLKTCKKLKVLKLGHRYISDEFFTGIGVTAPELTHLEFGSYGQISDKTFDSLAELKKLQILIIDNRRRWPSLTDAGLCHLIESCPKLKSIKFRRSPNITEKTIEALKASALRSPRIYFNHYLGINYRYFASHQHQDYNDCEDDDVEQCIANMKKNFPKNLVIDP